MDVKYLFNSSGEWICFKIDKNLFNINGEQVGWFPWNDEYAVSPKGEYIGSICNENRFYYFSNAEYRGYRCYPGYPGFAGYSWIPSFAKNVNFKK